MGTILYFPPHLMARREVIEKKLWIAQLCDVIATTDPNASVLADVRMHGAQSMLPIAMEELAQAEAALCGRKLVAAPAGTAMN